MSINKCTNFIRKINVFECGVDFRKSCWLVYGFNSKCLRPRVANGVEEKLKRVYFFLAAVFFLVAAFFFGAAFFLVAAFFLGACGRQCIRFVNRY